MRDNKILINFQKSLEREIQRNDNYLKILKKKLILELMELNLM